MAQYQNEVENYTVNGLQVFIITDSDPKNPRTEWDNAGTMVCWHRRYNLGDKHDYATPEAFREWANSQEGITLLPLYLYDHSGITMRTTPFSCPWDSGQVGYIYLTRDKQRECGIVDAESTLRQEVETYDQFLRGEVYGFSVQDSDGEVLDTSWGYFGLDHVKSEANAVANGFRDHVRWTMDKSDSPASATLSIRIDRTDFESIAGHAISDSDFTAAIRHLSRAMCSAVLPHEAQSKALRDSGVEFA